MPNTFSEGVRPGGLTSSTELRILLCYLLDNVDAPVSREQIEAVLLGEGLVNYFVLAEGLAQLKEQALITEKGGLYSITQAGRMVGRDLAQEVPRTVRQAAVNGVIRARQFAVKAATNQSEVHKTATGYQVRCSIGDDKGMLFSLELSMPNELTATTVRNSFVENGDLAYKIMLATLTEDSHMAADALAEMQKRRDG